MSQNGGVIIIHFGPRPPVPRPIPTLQTMVCEPCRKGDHEHCTKPIQMSGNYMECCCGMHAWKVTQPQGL